MNNVLKWKSKSNKLSNSNRVLALQGSGPKYRIKYIFFSPTNIVLFQHGTITEMVYYVLHAQIFVKSLGINTSFFLHN